ncbi:putative transcription factor interactor and regulator CCHC(Zn) family [Helianthus anomalus]
MRTSPNFNDTALTQLHGKPLTFERELVQKKKLQESGKVFDNYVFGKTTLLSHEGSSSGMKNDLKHIDPTNVEEMDILQQVALLSLRANNFYKRTSRTYLGLSGRSKAGLDKSKIKCCKCSRLGHFARECRSQSNHFALLITYPNQRPQSNTRQQFYQNTQTTLGPSVRNTTHFTQCINPVPVHYVPATPIPQFQYV